MKAPLTTFDRIQSVIGKSEQEGTFVVKFVLGKSEIECLKEWCRMDEMYVLDETCAEFTFRGVLIESVNIPSYFAYEVQELALA